MIVLTTTPSGVTLTQGDKRYTAVGPATLALLIRELTTPTPAQLGQRLAQVRKHHMEAI